MYILIEYFGQRCDKAVKKYILGEINNETCKNRIKYSGNVINTKFFRKRAYTFYETND